MTTASEGLENVLRLIGAIHRCTRSWYRASRAERAELHRKEWDSGEWLLAEMELRADAVAGIVSAIGTPRFEQHLLKHATTIAELQVLDEPDIARWLISEGEKYPNYSAYIAGVELTRIRLLDALGLVRGA